MLSITINLFLLTVLLGNRICIAQYIEIIQVDSDAKNRLSRAYNNPYHPEDDVEEFSDIDGDNLRYRKEDIEEKNKAKEDLKHEKKLKINGKYFKIKNDVRDDRPLGYDSE